MSATKLATPVRVSKRWWHSRVVLLLAFALSVMADPVSSVAYAIEAALHALHGNLHLLLAAMSMVVIVVALVVASYHHLVARFPHGGGAAAAAGKAFGEGWSFLPMGALIVDFVLTIAISVAAGAAAIISYVPGAAPYRLLIALGLLTIVAVLMWFGHLGRAVFALLTVGFVLVAVIVLISAFGHDAIPAPAVVTEPGFLHSAPIAVILAFPVAMALATGVEAPSSAIAQLAQLDDDGRRSFGRWALWLTLGTVGTLTIALTAAAVRLDIGLPEGETTMMSELARAGSSHAVFAAFQATTALLLLSAASSSFQAGPGLLKALARGEGSHHGVLPSFLGVTNKHHVPFRGVVVFYAASALVVAAAGARDQKLVVFYAVAVFVSFVVGLIAMAAFAKRDREWWWFALNVTAAVAVAFTLVANLTRLAAVGSLAATVIIGGALYYAWVRAGRPLGAAEAIIKAEAGAAVHEEPSAEGQEAQA